MANEDIKEILMEFQNPFTWKVEEGVALLRSLYPLKDNELWSEDMYIRQLMEWCLMVYEYVINSQMIKAKEKLDLCEQLYHEVCTRHRADIIEIQMGIKHVIDGTKCWYLYKNHEEDKLKEMIKTCTKIKDLNDEERGAVYGCESMIWSSFYELGVEKALETSAKAIKLNGTNPIWFLIRGGSLRLRRRILHVQSSPNDEEKMCFTTAYRKSQDPAYAVCYAQMLRELKYAKKKCDNIVEIDKEIIEIYKTVYKSNPNSKVLLKIALGFLRLENSRGMAWAKMCLDKVGESIPNDAMYLHYKGLYHEASNEYEKAVEYFQAAANNNNFPAEMSYINFGFKIGELNDPINYLLNMIEKYQNCSQERTQVMFLSLATGYYMIDKNYIKAAEYYLKAIEMDPKNSSFTGFYAYLGFNFKWHGSVFKFLDRTFLPVLRSRIKHDAPSLEICASIQKYCDDFKALEMRNSVQRRG